MKDITFTSTNIINIAQIGVGYWGPNLLRNLVANKECEVKTVVDLSEDRRDFVNSQYPSIVTTDQDNVVLDDETIDAVIIATPVATHFNIAIKCLKAGKHVLIEKPMATSVNQIKEINIIAKKNNLVAMVGHTFLYNSAVRFVKKYIDSGELGGIRYIYSQRLNLGRIRSDVDALWNLAPHDISIIQFWLDDPEPIAVKRSGQSYVQKGVDDVVFLNLSYKGGVMANIHVSWLDPHKVRKLTVVGTKKMIVYDDMADNKIAIYDKGIDPLAKIGNRMDFDDLSIQNYKHRSGDVILPKFDWKEPLQTEIEHFIACIKNNHESITNTTHAMRVVSILEQAS
jgi:predicted dehydrogenase